MSQYRQLHPGEPAPWFRQQSTRNPSHVFDTAAGRYIVLCFFGSAGDEMGRNALAFTYAHRGLFDDQNISFFGVRVDPQDEDNPYVRESIPGIRHFWDFDAMACRLYGALPISPKDEQLLRRLWVVLDPGLNVLAVLPFADDGSERVALGALLQGLSPIPMYAGLDMHASVIVLPKVFEPELCTRLIGEYDLHGGEVSGFMREINGKTVPVNDIQHKSRSDHLIEEESLRLLLQRRMHQSAMLSPGWSGVADRRPGRLLAVHWPSSRGRRAAKVAIWWKEAMEMTTFCKPWNTWGSIPTDTGGWQDESDTLSGGDGTDTIDFGMGPSSVGIEADLQTGQALSGSLGARLNSIENLVGTWTDDKLQGDAGANKLVGLVGDDLIEGRGGDDVLMGGIGRDPVDGGEGNDLVIQEIESWRDTLSGGAGTDVLDYSWNELSVQDRNSSGIEVDLVQGEVFKLLDAQWFDTVSGFETIIGTALNDRFQGDANANTFYGLAGNDTMFGGAGNDTLIGGMGNDVLQGGDGDDVYEFYRDEGVEQIAETKGWDTMRFGSDTVHTKLWFSRKDSDLNVQVVDTSDGVTIKNWYSSVDAKIEAIIVNNKWLSASGAEALVQAMAAFAPPAMGSGDWQVSAQSGQINAAIAANWR